MNGRGCLMFDVECFVCSTSKIKNCNYDFLLVVLRVQGVCTSQFFAVKIGRYNSCGVNPPKMKQKIGRYRHRSVYLPKMKQK